MELKEQKNEKVLFISPLEAKHFLLDIPKINPAYQKQAVQFALKSLYPGSDDDTSIDFTYNKNKVIGIATNKTKLEQYKTQYLQIVSPTLIIQNSFKNGIFILVSEKWVEIQQISGSLCFQINDYLIRNTKKILTKINELISGENNLPLYLISKDTSDSTIKDLLTSESISFLEKDFYQLITKKTLSQSEIFSNKQKKNKISLFYPCLILLIVLLSVYSFNLSKTEKQFKALANEKKQEYSLLKKTSLPAKTETIQNSITIEKKQSLYSIFEQIYKSSSSLKIVSFSMNENSFRFEAENANALTVLSKLQSSEILFDVNLIQSTPQENGKEKFIISGKIK